MKRSTANGWRYCARAFADNRNRRQGPVLVWRAVVGIK